MRLGFCLLAASFLLAACRDGSDFNVGLDSGVPVVLGDCPFDNDPTGTPCTMPGFACLFGDEDTCACVGPENVWACSFAGCPMSFSQNGKPCAVGVGADTVTCLGPSSLFCECKSPDDHWRCPTGAVDGGATD